MPYNCESSIGKLISILHRYSSMFFAKELEKINIGSGQLIFLISLLKNDGLSQEELASQLLIDKGTTARAVKKLEEEGFVRKQIDIQDKRIYRLYVTKKAEEIKDELFSMLRKWTEILTSEMNESEKNELIKLMNIMKNNAVNAIKSNTERKNLQ